MGVRVQQTPFDMGKEAQAFSDTCGGAGAVVTFTGLVRDLDTGTLDQMMIEHYPGMTEKALSKIHDEAMARWSLSDALIIHRYGPLRTGDTIMMVATAARHRGDAFEAAEYLMDYLKSRAPFWKKEIAGEASDWVASKAEDEEALGRWDS